VTGPLNTRRTGSGEPLVLIHGTGSNRQIWRRMLPALERQHEVLALDLPGHGGSAPLDGDPTPAALGAAVADEMDRAGWDTAEIVGHSLGGWIALELAAAGRARSVVAMAPSGGWTTAWERWYGELHLRTSRAVASAISPHVELLERLHLLRPAQGALLKQTRDIPAEDLYTAVRGLGSAESALAATLHQVASQARGLDRIDCPALLVWGTHDRLILPRQARYFERSIRGAELRWLEGIGHAPPLECPDLAAEAIVEFTGRLRATEPAPASADGG
jgi:pimeloyl-ACP methyl ester carboxylesterase